MINSQDILDFWFGEIRDGWTVQDRFKMWFGGGKELDGEIRSRFGEFIAPAAKGVSESAASSEFSEWPKTAMGGLALIILLDQFPRNIFRGTARAFAFDSAARAVCKDGIAAGRDAELPPVCRTFHYMPLEHSENLDDQNRSVELFRRLIDDAPAAHRGEAADGFEYAVKHRDIILEFGRFPHRNEIMERKSTAAETAYLQSGAMRFGQ